MNVEVQQQFVCLEFVNRNFGSPKWVMNVVINMRGMITYDNHSYEKLHKLQKKQQEKLINKDIAYFSNENDAKAWLIKNGESISKDIEDIYGVSVIFTIQKQNNNDIINCVETCLDDILYMGNGEKPYVFTKKAFKMMMNEIFILDSNDWFNDIMIPNYYLDKKLQIPMKLKCNNGEKSEDSLYNFGRYEVKDWGDHIPKFINYKK